jgi:hypothetical protein
LPGFSASFGYRQFGVQSLEFKYNTVIQFFNL